MLYNLRSFIRIDSQCTDNDICPIIIIDWYNIITKLFIEFFLHHFEDIGFINFVKHSFITFRINYSNTIFSIIMTIIDRIYHDDYKSWIVIIIIYSNLFEILYSSFYSNISFAPKASPLLSGYSFF